MAEGFLTIAIDNMANAIKQISTQRGYDVTEYTLCCFGGAGGQHACGVADALGMKTVLIHPLAGVLSAYGIGLADVRVLKQQAVEAPLSEALLAALQPVLVGLETKGREELRRQMEDTPPPQPSPTRGEGVIATQLLSLFPFPSWEGVRGRG